MASLIVFLALGLDRYLTLESLARNRDWLRETVARHRVIAVSGFIAVYTLAAALSVPGGAILTITGGFLFGVVPGTVYTVIGATTGATMLFAIAKSTFGESLRARAGGFVQNLEAGFREHALSYLLFLRFVPLFPFWLVNLVPAFLGVSLRIFVIGTFFGIIPGSLVYASVGNGLGAILDQGQTPDLGLIFRPQILLPILGLALLALVPVAYKKVHQRRKSKEEPHA